MSGFHHFSSSEHAGYRFGFNGKEKDDEVKGNGNSLDFHARIYDPRLGRWLTIDPKAGKYPYNSPYVGFGNNPIYYIDPAGETLKVAGKDGQKQALAQLTRAFGENAKGFSFNDDDVLVYSGSPKEFMKAGGDELDVFKGVIEVINSKDVTEVIFEKNKTTVNYGGEATILMSEFPNETQNTIYIDPIEISQVPIKEDWQTSYYTKTGGTTTDPNLADVDKYGRPRMTGQREKVTTYSNDSKAARFFHGIGHVLFPKNSELEEVIKFDNKARSIFKKEGAGGKFKRNPDSVRTLDDSHKNRP